MNDFLIGAAIGFYALIIFGVFAIAFGAIERMVSGGPGDVENLRGGS